MSLLARQLMKTSPSSKVEKELSESPSNQKQKRWQTGADKSREGADRSRGAAGESKGRAEVKQER